MPRWNAESAAELLDQVRAGALARRSDGDGLADLLGYAVPRGRRVPGGAGYGPPWSAGPFTADTWEQRHLWRSDTPPILTAEPFRSLPPGHVATRRDGGKFGASPSGRPIASSPQRYAPTDDAAEHTERYRGLRTLRVGLVDSRARVPATPAGAHALVAAATVAGSFADHLDDLADEGTERDARKWRTEADEYRAYAALAELGLDAAIDSWIDAVGPVTRPTPAHPTVPAIPAGPAYLATT